MTSSSSVPSNPQSIRGSAASVPQAAAMFISGHVDSKKVAHVLGEMSVVTLGFVGTCLLLFVYTPLFWALLGAVLVFAVAGVMVTHALAELIIAFATVERSHSDRNEVSTPRPKKVKRLEQRTNAIVQRPWKTQARGELKGTMRNTVWGIDYAPEVNRELTVTPFRKDFPFLP